MIDFDKIKNDNVREFESLFDLYYEQLVAFACYYLSDQDAAENIVQDVFVNIWKKRKKINLKSSIKVYLYSATKKNALRYLRDKKNRKKFVQHLSPDLEVQHLPHDTAEYHELVSAIEQAIQSLPEKGRLIFCMNRFDHLSYSEIARVLNISVNTVEAHMVRNLRHLRNFLNFKFS
jgi:RNA polymerase sigma-70 factor (ECF subfamily)